MLTIERAALEELSAILLERAGLKIAADGFHGLRLALKERMPILGIDDAAEYVKRLRTLSGEVELRALLPLVTVTHTEFFRDPRQFAALERRVLPEALARARKAERRVSVWSAGCATGEEPYSLAMLLADLGASPEEVDLWATDLNAAAVGSARTGRYTARRMATVSPERTRKYFQPSGEDLHEVLPFLKEYVRFEGHNLAAPVFSRVPDASFDVILCRNVIIYFDLPTIRGLMDRFYAALRPGGFLVLGYSESLFRVYDRFEMVEVEGAFLYRRPKSGQARPSGVLPPKPAPSTGDPLRPPTVRPKTTGEYPIVVPAQRPRLTGEYPIVVPAARAPSETESRQTPATPMPVITRRPPAERMLEVARRVGQGRFEEALDLLAEIRRDEPDDLASLLTLGNLYSVMKRSDEATGVFQEAATREPLCVEVRVYAGMNAMQQGDFERARSELGKALFLEPTLALAHYLSAQVAERLGDREAARRSYRNAIAQLRFSQRPLAGFYPDLPDSPDLISRAAKYALAALEEC